MRPKTVVVALIVSAAASAVAVYLLPERDTEIRRDVLAENIRVTVSEFGPLVNDFKDFKR